MPAASARRSIAVVVAVTGLLAAWSLVAAAWAQNLWRPVDPYRAGAVRAGMLDWPIRGNRLHDRAWMHDNLYCCRDVTHTRVLYAAATPYGPLVLLEGPGHDQPWPALHMAGMTAFDVDVPARPEQVSAIVPLRDDAGRAVYVLLVVGRPGTTRVRYRETDGAPPVDLPLHRGAGWTFLSSGTGWHPNDVVVTVERHGRVVSEGTVTTFAGQCVECSFEAPAPLVPLPPPLRRVAGERVDHLAFRYCLATAYEQLPTLVPQPPEPLTSAEADRTHRHILRGRLRDLALHPAVRAVEPSGIRAAIPRPGSAVASAVIASCEAYDAIGRET